MAGPLRIFISHSSGDAVLAQAVAGGLRQIPNLAVLIDQSGLEAGKPWRRQLHEWMARCGAGVVLLTPAVLARPEWVLKEAIILGWRLDLERKFSLFFALAPGVTRKQFQAAGFDLAQLSETQFVPGNLADPAVAARLVAHLENSLPKAQPRTPFDELLNEVTKLLRVADPTGATYADIATHLGLAQAPLWGPDQVEKLAELIACHIVQGRDDHFAIDALIDLMAPWTRENRAKLVNLLVPFWIDGETAGALLRRAPPQQLPAPPPQEGPHPLTIAGARVPEFTADMTVRRAFGVRLGNFRLAPAVGLNGGDLFQGIRDELCDYARLSSWVARNMKKNEDVVEKLRTSTAPIFAPLGTLPDAATIKLLREEFPRVLFVAPRPTNRTQRVGDELTPDPIPKRESDEFEGWEKAMNAITNG